MCPQLDFCHFMCRDYCEGLRDSLDLVPIGAWHGNGRKVGWLSPFLLAAWDPATEQFQSVCRCMSGFTDVFYQQVGTQLPAHSVKNRVATFEPGMVAVLASIIALRVDDWSCVV